MDDDYDQIVWVTYRGVRVLKDDTVEVQGRVRGLYSYKTIMGGTLTIPNINSLIGIVNPQLYTDLVFCYGDGKPWGEKYISNRYEKIVEKSGITKKVGLHTLRHTYATLNLQHDDIQNVSRTLGHRHISTTKIFVIEGTARK